MTNKSIRDYINLIENAQREEVSESIGQEALRKDREAKAEWIKNNPLMKGKNPVQQQAAWAIYSTFHKPDADKKKEEGSLEEYGDTAKGQKMLSKVHHRAADRVTSKQADKDPAYARKAQQTQDRAWDRLAVKEEGVESWSGNPSDRRHSGHESYMTPEYMLDHYKKRLAQIAAGKHKYPKEVAQLQAKIAKLEKQCGQEGSLEEAKPEAIEKVESLFKK